MEDSLAVRRLRSRTSAPTAHALCEPKWPGRAVGVELGLVVLLALSPSVAQLGELKPVHKLGRRMHLGLLIAVTAVPVAISIYLAFGEYIAANDYCG